MIFLVLPYNFCTGWGICSINLAKEISKKHKIKYVSTEFADANRSNIIQHEFFKKSFFNDIDYLKNKNNYPIIQAIQHDLSPYIDYLSGKPKIAITFADRKIPKDLAEKAKHYDHIIAGSEWCKKILNSHGVDSIVIHQGIDPLIFNQSRSEKCFFSDDFLIFSGGKFEARKEIGRAHV